MKIKAHWVLGLLFFISKPFGIEHKKNILFACFLFSVSIFEFNYVTPQHTYYSIKSRFSCISKKGLSPVLWLHFFQIMIRERWNWQNCAICYAFILFLLFGCNFNTVVLFFFFKTCFFSRYFLYMLFQFLCVVFVPSKRYETVALQGCQHSLKIHIK